MMLPPCPYRRNSYANELKMNLTYFWPVVFFYRKKLALIDTKSTGNFFLIMRRAKNNSKKIQHKPKMHKISCHFDKFTRLVYYKTFHGISLER